MGRKATKERAGRGPKPLESKAARTAKARAAKTARGAKAGQAAAPAVGDSPAPAAPALADGMRVRLKETERWVAGLVQAGATGTVYFARMKDALGGEGSFVMPCVRWDRIKPPEGRDLHFAIGTRTDMVLPGWLELISQEGGRG